MELKKKKKAVMNIFVSPDTIELNPPSLSVWGRSWEKENISEGKEKI